MKLMQRIFVEKRLAITIVITAVVVDIALYALVVLPGSVALTNARQRAELASSDLIAAEQALAMARTTVDGKLEADRELQNFYRENTAKRPLGCAWHYFRPP